MKIIKISETSDASNDTSNNDVVCPFCKEGEFDLIGLKNHLVKGDCEAYNNININELRPRLF